MFDYQDNLDALDEYEFEVKGRKLRPRSKGDRRLKLSHSQMKAEIAELDERAITKRAETPRPSREQQFYSLVEEDRNRQNFNPTLGALTARSHMSNHEREWILKYLGTFYNDHMISDVIRRVKAGKEATVYCCRAEPETGFDLLAGKVYHERMFRSLKNDAIYREGRDTLDERGKSVYTRRELLAMQKKTRFGQDLRQLSWLTAEFAALQKLYDAGADIPKPVAQSENAILMEYLGGADYPAPALVNVTLDREEARPLFERLMANVELMLANDVIHGDLSAHNILYWEGEAKIIDFPQAVNPYINHSAYALFERDVTRVCQYFTRYGVACDGPRLAAEIWARVIPS